MKHLKVLILAFTFLMIAALIVIMKVNRDTDYKGRDLSSYNDMLYKINSEYLRGDSVSDIEKRYNCRIVLSNDLVNSDISELYSKGAFVLDLAPEGEIIGKVAWNDKDEGYQNKVNELYRTMIIIWTIMLVVGYLLILLIYISVIRPIREFERFSDEVAKGNLDVKLPIRRINLFGNFTESFDMMREQLRASRKREAEAEKAKRELVAELSHDIKTPVSTIKATCEVMDVELRKKLEGAGDGEKTTEIENSLEKVGYISAKADTISQLVNSMFHLAIEEEDTIKVNPVEKNSVEIEEYFGRLKDYGNIILDNHIPECLVYMDSLRMEQVIDNIVGNSYKYAGTDIRVSFEETEAMEDSDGKSLRFIRIRIKDDGPGVDEEELPLITEKYYRGKNSQDKNGYGLGLYLVKWYMEKMGGGMECYNDDGFVVELLLRKV